MPVNNISLTVPTDYSVEQQAIERQRKMAEALQQQSMTPMDANQMAGGYVIPVSPMQGLAKMLQAYTGRRSMDAADQKQTDLATRVQGDRSSDMQALLRALSPARPPATPMDDNGNPQPIVAGGGGITPELISGLRSPEMQGAMFNTWMQQNGPKAPIKLGKDESLIDPVTMRPVFQSPLQPKYHVVEGNLVAEPTQPGAPVNPAYTAPAKPAAPTELARLQAERAALPPGDPRIAQYNAAIAKATTHQPSASNNVTIKQEGAEAGAVGKEFGEQFSTLQKAAMAANTKLSKLDRMESLLNGVSTGKLTPAGTEIAALADSLGMKIDKNLGNKQAAQALSSEIALELRNPSGGAGMPGAMSDKDREFLQSMTPSLSQTPEGNKLIIESARKLAKRDQEVAKLARDYRQKTGHMDEGFYNELQQFADNNPLFTPKRRASDKALSGFRVLGAE